MAGADPAELAREGAIPGPVAAYIGMHPDLYGPRRDA
jgi:hypothetical protein